MPPRHSFDPTQLEIFKNLFHSVAEEMGGALRRSAFSPNIKERRDYSCAVFDSAGRVLAMGDHMPAHLGSMPRSVAAVMQSLDLDPGDIALLNDAYAGGTHLPDLTLVMPVYLPHATKPMFYVANRAHHADIGGAQAGSMGLAREIFQEGLRIPPVLIYRRGQLVRDVMNLLLWNVRTPREREGDLTAQIAACRIGERRLIEIVGRYGEREAARYGDFLLDYSEEMMRSVLRSIPDGVYRAEDFMDDDGISPEPLRIAAEIRIRRGSAAIDFTGSAPECQGNINAVIAITESSIFYVFRCLVGEDVPATAGLMRPIRVIAPERTIVNAGPPRAVAGANVETSQRIADVLLRALARAVPGRIPAASQGTMNNFTFGGLDTRPGRAPSPFAYYETIAGGMGARPDRDGISGIHTNMTNSLNTPVEVLEISYPVRVHRYGLRRRSGGAGCFRGGDGVVREVEMLVDSQIGLLCERRTTAPYGLEGGAPGAKGLNQITYPVSRAGKFARAATKRLPSKCNLYVPAGSVIRVETPGGGGYGKPRQGQRQGNGRAQSR